MGLILSSVVEAQMLWNESADYYSAGRLSLGTSTNSDKLSIEGTGEWHVRLTNNADGQDWRIGSTETGWAAGAGKSIISNNPATPSAALVIDPQRRVGIGTYSSQVFLNIGPFIPNGTLGAVLGRISEGNTTGSGTYLSLRGHATQQDEYDGKNFSLEHTCYGTLNSSVNFFRGIAMAGGFLTFNTNTNIERMRIPPNGSVGIGNINPQALLNVSGNLILRNTSNVIHAGASIHFTSYDCCNPTPVIKNLLHLSQGTASALNLNCYREEYNKELYLYNGRVGIDISNPDATLTLKGTVHAEEVKRGLNVPVPDDVFKKDYNLRPLVEVEIYINQNKCLQKVPAAKTRKRMVLISVRRICCWRSWKS
jgi:hypothetical protein